MFGTCSMTHDQSYLFLCLSISVFLLYKYIYDKYSFESKALHVQLSSLEALSEGLEELIILEKNKTRNVCETLVPSLLTKYATKLMKSEIIGMYLSLRDITLYSIVLKIVHNLNTSMIKQISFE